MAEFRAVRWQYRFAGGRDGFLDQAGFAMARRDQFSLCGGEFGGSSGEGPAGAGFEVALEAAIFARGGGANLQNRFRPVGVVPEHFRLFHAKVDLPDR